jgi:hypothetical protein
MGDNLMDAKDVRDFPKINRWLALAEFYDQSDEVNILAALAHGQNNGALYLLTMGDCQQMCDRIACENLRLNHYGSGSKYGTPKGNKNR